MASTAAKVVLGTLGVLSGACQQPAAAPPPASHTVAKSRTPPAPHAVEQHHEAEELSSKVAYPGLQTLSEAFPEGSFTIDAQDAATRGALLLASVDHRYDLERATNGHIVLSFLAATKADYGIETGPLYFVQLQCSDEQANALRNQRPSRSPLRKVTLRVIFRLTTVSAARPILDFRSSEDQAEEPIPATVGFSANPPLIVLRGTLVAFSPFDGVSGLTTHP